MNRTGLIGAMTSVIALSLLLVLPSCVNEEYTLSEDKLNLEVTVFQDGLSVPLGSTSKIMLKDVKDSLLANVEDQDLLKYFTVGENGEYGIALSDRLDLSDTLNNLLAQIDIPDVTVSETFAFNLNSVDVSDLNVPAAEYSYSENLGDVVSVPNFTFNGFGTDMEVSAGLYKYKPSEDVLKLDFPEVVYGAEFAGLTKDLRELQESPLDERELSIDELSEYASFLHLDLDLEKDLEMNTEFGPLKSDFSFSMSLPAGIKSVEDIVLGESARVKMSIGLTNSLFTSGIITPSLDLDVSEIFVVESSENNHIKGAFNVDASVNTPAVMEFGIESIVFKDEDWSVVDGHLTLTKNITLSVSGDIAYSYLKTKLSHLKNQGLTKMGFNLKMEFVDFQVEDVRMTVEPITVEVPKNTVAFKQSIQLPEQIKGIDYVTLSDDSKISMNIVPENMLPGLELEMESLVLTFPEGIEVEGAQNGVLTYANEDLSRGFSRDIRLKSITLPKPVNGIIELDKEVSVEAVVKAEGTVGSADLPSSADKDLRVKVEVNADFAIADYSVAISGYDYPIEYGQEFEFDVTGLEQFGTVTVIPQGNPEIVVDIQMPDSGIRIVADPKENLVIAFPQMLKFKNLPKEYNYDAEAGTVTLKGTLPSEIVLPIDRLVVSPVKEGDKYWARGEFKVSGGVAIPAGNITKADITALTDPECVVGMSARIPDIQLGTIAMDEAYEVVVDKKFEVGMMSADELPEQLVSIDRVEFEDVFFTMNLDATKLPDLGQTTLSLDFEVDLPEMIVLDSENVKDGNVLSIKGQLGKDGMLTVDPVRIAALDLSDIDFKNLEDLKDTIAINGKVILDNIALDVNEWLGKALEVSVDAGIKDIMISKVLGKVDVQVPAMSSTVDLTPYKGYLTSDNMQVSGIENLLSRLNIAAEIKTNVGVPLGARMVITPYADGTPGTEWSEDITLNHSQAATDTTYTRYWLSLDEESADSYRPEGYTHIHVPIRKYLEEMPDSLKISVEAGSDPGQMCIVEPSHKYVVEAAYSVAMPIEFGEGTSVTYRDTIPDIPELVEQLLEMGDLVLTGEVTSSLPVEISMKANLLDADGNVIPLDEKASSQKIAGCTPDADPVVTELYIGLQKKEGVEVKGVSAIELEFNLVPVAGVPLSDNCFIQASLQALVPEGVSVDAKELMKENEE